jgi:molybdate transport system substrate-binding protein
MHLRTTICLCLLLLASCSGGATDKGPEKLRVFAAASMHDAVLKAAMQRGGEVSLSDGASGTLARQIIDGAPADVFISASPEWMQQVAKAGKLQGEPVLLARNELVVAVQKDAKMPFVLISDFLAQVDMIAIADEKAPAGKYARQALAKLKAPDSLNLVGQDDVRGVLHAVQTGNAPAGFVYRSDVAAFADSMRVLFEIDPALHDPIEIHGGVVAASTQQAAARDFLDYFKTEAGRNVLQSLGFKAP